MTLPDLDPWRRLAACHTMLEEAHRLLRAVRALMVNTLRDAGITWQQIADEAGISRQRAQQWADTEETR